MDKESYSEENYKGQTIEFILNLFCSSISEEDQTDTLQPPLKVQKTEHASTIDNSASCGMSINTNFLKEFLEDTSEDSDKESEENSYEAKKDKLREDIMREFDAFWNYCCRLNWIDMVRKHPTKRSSTMDWNTVERDVQ